MTKANTTSTAELPSCAATITSVPDAFIDALKNGQAISAATAVINEAMFHCDRPVALPADFELHDLEHYMEHRRRQRGAMTTRFIAPFAAYAAAFSEDGATVFVDPEDMSATAVLNLGTADAPGHADNTAKLTPQKTAAYKALLQLCGMQRSQRDVAEFLEDWAAHIECFDAEGAIKTAQAIAAVRKITIESAQQIESEEKSLSASRSAFESIKATSKEPLPTTICFTCAPYADLGARTFALRLGVLTTDKIPKLVLRLQKAEQHEEEMANELVERITEQTNTPVLIGRYSKSQ